VLEAAGRAARRAGAMATAVWWLDKAAAMAGDRASVRLIMDRAEAHLVTGSAGLAADSYQTLLTRDDVDSRTRLEIVWMLARAQATVGQHGLAAATFEHAAGLARESDPATGVQVLDAAYCAWLSGGAAPAMALASRARDLAGRGRGSGAGPRRGQLGRIRGQLRASGRHSGCPGSGRG
jgi:hypothetical protein